MPSLRSLNAMREADHFRFRRIDSILASHLWRMSSLGGPARLLQSHVRTVHARDNY